MFENGKRPHITVVGDLILDRYLIGDATRLNPEQPGVVIRVDKEEDRLGGAAAVAMIAAELGAHVTLAGVVGRDEPGGRLQHLIADHGIEPHLWIDDRPTTWKQRIIARGQLRPDRCDREVTTTISDHAAQFLATAPLGDMVLISDYGKGVCTRRLLTGVGNRSRRGGVPILVDPARARDWSDYGGVTLIKGNWSESIEASNGAVLTPLALSAHLAHRFKCQVVVTMGSHGMTVAERTGAVRHFPAVPQATLDVSGAGDTVLAAIGWALASGTSLWSAAKFASTAAGFQVSQFGVNAIPTTIGVAFSKDRVGRDRYSHPARSRDPNSVIPRRTRTQA